MSTARREPALRQLRAAARAVTVGAMSNRARTYRGYRYYGFPNGSPGLAARV